MEILHILDFSRFLPDTYSVVLSAVAAAALMYLAIYYGLYYMRVGLHDRKRTSGAAEASDLPPVSVVLVARNDADWLKENLVYLLEQDYPRFEVVVVNYLSTDDTEFVLKLLHDYYPHLKTVSFKEDVNLFQGKKYPLSIGIQNSAYDIIMLADPDCTPKNLQWLRGMVRGYRSEQTKIVIGYCGLKRTKTLLGCLQQYDALCYGAQYLGAALLGHPYTASGRNLSYKRSFFFEKGGLIKHYVVADGSDDLFVYQNATRRNTTVCIDSDACLTADPKPTFALWRDERRHRVGTRSWHSLAGRLRESMPAWMNLLFYGAAVGLVLLGNLPWVIVAVAAAVKWAWQIVCFSMLTKRFEGGYVHWAAPLLEIYFIIANTILILLPLPSNRKFK